MLAQSEAQATRTTVPVTADQSAAQGTDRMGPTQLATSLGSSLVLFVLVIILGVLLWQRHRFIDKENK